MLIANATIPSNNTDVVATINSKLVTAIVDGLTFQSVPKALSELENERGRMFYRAKGGGNWTRIEEEGQNSKFC